MSSKYDAAFAPRDPSELFRDALRAATASVQSSLYGRLKRMFGSSRAGTIAWMMIHASDPAHRDHDAAHAALVARSFREVAELWDASGGALKAAKTPEAKKIAERVHLCVSAVAGSMKEMNPKT